VTTAQSAAMPWGRGRARACWVLVLGILLTCAAAPADAARRDFHFEPLAIESGLVQNTVNDLLQDADGYVWIATQGGLHRYDGRDVRVFRHMGDAPDSLPDSFVSALAEARSGGLWVGTNTRFVVYFDTATGRARALPASSLSAVDGHQQVTALLDDGQALWVASPAGVERLGHGADTFAPVLELGPGRSAHDLAVDGEGTLWVAASDGLHRIGPDGEPMRVHGLPGGASVHPAPDGGVWYGADALYRVAADGASHAERWRFPGGRPLINPPNVLDITSDRAGRIWLSVSNNGVVRLDPTSGETRHAREVPGIPASLPEDSVRKLMVDRSGLLWVGGMIRGVSVTDPAGTRFTYLTDLESRRGWVDANSMRAIADAGDNRLWLGTDSDGLKRVDIDSGVFQDHSAPLRQALPEGKREAVLRVMGLVPAAGGRWWVGTTLGLFEFDPAVGSARLEPVGLPPGEVRVPEFRRIDPASGGALWIGTSQMGLLHYDPANGRLRQFRRDPTDPNSLSNDFVHCAQETRGGEVWVCTNAGLNLLDPDTGHVQRFEHDPTDPGSLSGDRIRAIHEARDGTLWIGTHSGLNRLVRLPDGRFAFDRFNRLHPRDERGFIVFNLLEDGDGMLWLGTNEGILRFDPGRERFRAFQMRDGLQDPEFNGGAQLALDDGRLVLGGIRGINVFEPAAIRDHDHQPPVVLLAARVGGAPENLVGLRPPANIEIPQEARTLRLRFGALDYAAPDRIRYRYRLEGFDTDWVESIGPTEATYTNLRGGDYVFRAMATNHDGIWSPHELVLPLRVVPPWWSSPAAGIAYLLLLGAIAWGIWTMARRRRRQEKQLLAEIRERDERLKLALWGSGDEFWDWNISDNRIYRLGGKQLFSVDGAAPLSTDAWRSQAIHPDDLPRVQKVLQDHILGHNEAFESEHRIRSPDGQWLWVRSRGKVVERDTAGQPLRIAGTAHDITARRRAERDSRIAGEVLRSMAEAVAVVDLQFRFFSVNPAFSRITGYAAEEVAGQRLALLDSSQHDASFYEKVRGIMLDTGHWAGEMWQRRKDGEEFLGWLECSEVCDDFGGRSHFVIVVTDVTDKKRAEQELRYLANYDTLTGLPNRALLSERLARAIVRARRQDTKVAVLFLDLDRFKDINDSLGHAAGDRILKATAARLLATVSSSDTVARLSGDEFTVVLEDVEGLDAVDRTARDILNAFAEPLDIDDRHDVTISPSIGISLYPDHALVPTDLLKFADTAMYQAKSIGRNTYQVYTEAMDAETRRRALMTAALRRALDRGEFRLVFQPRLSLTDGSVTGVEALLRWHSSELGEIPPDVFIPLAEETGLILKIGEWVLREACLTLRRWRRHGLNSIAVSVNVSVLQLLRGHLPELLLSVLAETGVPAERVELEVTESMVMANAEQTTAVLKRLREIGVSIAIDDFGTGYSSLVYLKRLPIDTLKIDKEFVGDLTRDPDDEAITATVITMAHSLGLNVVAEGVETQAQMDYLRAQGCDEIQGFWLSPPLDAHHCLAFMRTWQPSLAPEADA